MYQYLNHPVFSALFMRSVLVLVFSFRTFRPFIVGREFLYARRCDSFVHLLDIDNIILLTNQNHFPKSYNMEMLIINENRCIFFPVKLKDRVQYKGIRTHLSE